jgi:hypothetical protein
MNKDGAQRLNVTDSIRVAPGEDLGTMLGVYHNLHCLVIGSNMVCHTIETTNHGFTAETDSADDVLGLLLPRYLIGGTGIQS